MWWQEDWVLCRVFHKIKGDEQNTRELTQQLGLETANIPSFLVSSSTASPPTDSSTIPFAGYSDNQQMKPSCHNHHHYQNPNNNSTNNQASFLDFLRFSQGKTTDQNIASEITTKISEGDEYEFLWDMNNLEGNSSLDDMRFEIDNSTVFLWKLLHTTYAWLLWSTS